MFSNSSKHFFRALPPSQSGLKFFKLVQDGNEGRTLYNYFHGRHISAASPSKWELVIGLEIHVQVNSSTKLFSGARTGAAAQPNSNVALFDASHPGTLPVLNWGCVEAAARTGFALGGVVNRESHFDRKHYFYADNPHGFQITQHEHPIVTGGSLPVKIDGQKEPKNIPIQRIQLETDTGKSLHDGHPDMTLLDFNRAGSALMEVVTGPEMRSAAEAAAFVKTFQTLLRHINTSTANMEDGTLRVDVNISLFCPADGRRSARCEVKNLNSLRSISKAVEFEANRHRVAMEAEEEMFNETRTFDVANSCTIPLRDKETALDYRFMPEPDLPTLVLDECVLDELRRSTPELPEVTVARLQAHHHFTQKQAEQLVKLPGAVAFFHSTLEALGSEVSAKDTQGVFKLLMGDFLKELNAQHLDFANIPPSASAERLAKVLESTKLGKLSGRMAKPVIAALVRGDNRPFEEVLEDVCGGEVMTNANELEDVCKVVLQEYSAKVEEYLKGRSNLMGLFVGQVMKRTGGRADPKRVNFIIEQIIRSSDRK